MQTVAWQNCNKLLVHLLVDSLTSPIGKQLFWWVMKSWRLTGRIATLQSQVISEYLRFTRDSMFLKFWSNLKAPSKQKPRCFRSKVLWSKSFKPQSSPFHFKVQSATHLCRTKVLERAIPEAWNKFDLMPWNPLLHTHQWNFVSMTLHQGTETWWRAPQSPWLVPWTSRIQNQQAWFVKEALVPWHCLQQYFLPKHFAMELSQFE